jgi:hypothetical protein
METAVDTLRAKIQLTVDDPGPVSHSVIVASGFEDPDAVTSFAVYLTGLVAGIVQVDLRFLAELCGEGEDYGQALQAMIQEVVLESNDPDVLDDHTRTHYRDPWIAECLAHVVLMLARGAAGPCVPAVVQAMTVPHAKVTQSGFDLVALYDPDAPALCIGESKSSEDAPQDQLGKAVRLFREIDDGARNREIIHVVTGTLRGSLPQQVQERLYEFFWNDRRMYLPLIGYAAGCAFNPGAERTTTLGALQASGDLCRLVVVPLENYRAFYNGVASGMRAATAEFI